MRDFPARYIMRGQTLSFQANPFETPACEAALHESDGALLVDKGRIADIGPAQSVMERAGRNGAMPPIYHYRDHLIMAGFVDAHIHYPQMDIIGAHNHGLLHWLETHTFPKELEFHDRDVARDTASLFLEECFRHGVTSASVYCTVHPQSVDEFFTASTRYNALMAAGKTCMDREAPTQLCDTAQSAYDQSKALLENWHGKGRNVYAITPRFAITSTPTQLEALGALWAEHPNALMQTHLSETLDEIEKVRGLFPGCRDYFGVYEEFGLAGPGGIYGHGVFLSDDERARLSESGGAIAHCPTSNAFLGSGVFDLMSTLRAAPQMRLSLASDVGGGSTFSMLGVMRSAYEAARSYGAGLSPLQLFWLASVGGASAMRQNHRIGNLTIGFDADFILFDLHSTPLLERRAKAAASLEELLMAQMMLGDDRAIKATFVAGAPVFDLPDAH